jgi:sugar lactone lactonase YvrE
VERRIVLALLGSLAAIAPCARVAGADAPSAEPPSGPPAELHIPGARVVPESLSSAADGTVYISSVGTGIIRRAAPGSDTALPWIQPAMGARQAVLGLYADDRSGTLWACANTRSAGNDSVVGSPSELQAFELRTGAPRGRYPLPTPGALCNDIATGPDDTVYATDTYNMQVVRLRPGAAALEVWSAPGAFGPVQGRIDGIAVLGTTVYVNTVESGQIYAVPIGPGGNAGAAMRISVDRSLDHPDGMRSHGTDTVLLVEGGIPGRLSELRLAGGRASTRTLKEGFPDDSVAVTVVGRTAYVLEAQWRALSNDPHYTPKPFHATAVSLGAP